jgi:hypothetical protein
MNTIEVPMKLEFQPIALFLFSCNSINRYLLDEFFNTNVIKLFFLLLLALQSKSD